jgi:hypothetical protein
MILILLVLILFRIDQSYYNMFIKILHDIPSKVKDS